LQVFLSVGDVEWIFKRDSRINESLPLSLSVSLSQERWFAGEGCREVQEVRTEALRLRPAAGTDDMKKLLIFPTQSVAT
jgi:hypothetical protein